MTCFHPNQAYKSKETFPSGKHKITYNPKSAIDCDPFSRLNPKLPCRQCCGCRLKYSRDWAVRIMHEVQTYLENGFYSSFITLTYNDEFLPKDGSLNYEHWNRFIDRVRTNLRRGVKYIDSFGVEQVFKVEPKIRFFMGPEYGDKSMRPHYHAILFGVDFPDKVLHSVRNGHRLYVSKILDRLWTDPKSRKPYGYTTVGTATFESAAYVARYIMKKVRGEDHQFRYWSVPDDDGVVSPISPEVARMSRMPGIAKDWFDKYSTDVYPSDQVVFKGKPVQPPSYYDRLFKAIDPDVFDDIRSSRVDNAEKASDNCSPDRLEVREFVQLDRISRLVRELE